MDIEKRILRRSGPTKAPIAGGVTSVVSCQDGRVLAGSGDGSVRYLQAPGASSAKTGVKPIREIASHYLNSKAQGAAITTLLIEAETHDDVTLLTGTAAGDLYRVFVQKDDNRYVLVRLITRRSEVMQFLRDVASNIAHGRDQCRSLPCRLRRNFCDLWQRRDSRLAR